MLEDILVRVEDSRADCRANRTASLIRLPEAMSNGVEAVCCEARDMCVAENMPVDMATPSKIWLPRRILMHDTEEEDAHYTCICEALANKLKIGFATIVIYSLTTDGIIYRLSGGIGFMIYRKIGVSSA